MGALLKLEQFDRLTAPAPSAPVFSLDDIREARAQGVAQGRAEADKALSDRVCAALDDVAARVAQHQADLFEEITGQARSLAPLVSALLDGVVPAVARARLEAALLTQLVDLAGAVAPLSARLRCGADLAPFVAACLERSGLATVEIVPGGTPGSVEAELLGGRITWDIATVSDQLRALVQDILEGH